MMAQQISFDTKYLLMGRESNLVFKSVLFPMGIPLPPLWGETLIGALGVLVTYLIIDLRFTERNNTHTINGLYSCSMHPLSKMWSVKLFACLNTCLQPFFIISYFPVLASPDCNVCFSSLIFSIVQQHRIYLSHLFPCLEFVTQLREVKWLFGVFSDTCAKSL